MIDFTLTKQQVPNGRLYAMNEILSWTHKQTDENRRCLYCDGYGSFGIVPKDGYMQYYCLCGDHYSNEKTKKGI